LIVLKEVKNKMKQIFEVEKVKQYCKSNLNPNYFTWVVQPKFIRIEEKTTGVYLTYGFSMEWDNTPEKLEIKFNYPSRGSLPVEEIVKFRMMLKSIYNIERELKSII